MQKSCPRLLHCGLILAAALGALTGCTAPRPVAPAYAPERLRALGTVQIDADARMVVATGFVNQVEGAIELLVCGPGGKTHESVFVMQAHAMDLQAALLLIGLKPGEPRQELGEGPPRGPRVDVWITWVDADGRRVAQPAEFFAYNVETEKVLPFNGWAFTGSVVIDGQFKALAEESFIVTFWDPWAILNIRNEGGSNDEWRAVNRAVVPPLHTPVTFLMVPHERP